jgi:glycosyltransferase involved in cell wall biosynthesis
MLGRIGETWIITRENNRARIESALPLIPEAPSLHFTYVDLPRWARFWKKGARGLRLYYVLWQFAAYARARAMLRRLQFHLVWHVTLANAWVGSGAALVSLPFVYGPVGGGVAVPWKMVSALGVRGAAFEVVTSVVRTSARYLNPLARLSWRRAKLILVQNEETRQWMPARYRSKAVVFPNVVLNGDEDARFTRARRPGRTAVFAGRLIPWKGGALALRTIADLPEWSLLMCGSGFDHARLKRLGRRLGVQDRVRFLGDLPRQRLFDLMNSEADVFFFPSLREEAGWVVAEALTLGLPVVCIDRGGPPSLGGVGAPPSTPRATTAALRIALERAVASKPPRPTSFELDRRFDLLIATLEPISLFTSDTSPHHEAIESQANPGAS